VTSEPAAEALRITLSDAAATGDSLGPGTVDPRVIALPIEVDPEALLAEERRQRDAQGIPQFTVVDLRQTTLESITP
jgi:hypothetical protein